MKKRKTIIREIRGLRVKKEIPVLLRDTGDDYVARFVEANCGSSGETVAEAVDNLKDIIATQYEIIRRPGIKLSPVMQRYAAVLQDHLEPL